MVILPGYDATAAAQLADTLRTAIPRLAMPNSEPIAADYLSATVAVSSGYVTDEVDRIKLLMQAISSVQASPAHGENQVNAMTA